MKPSEEKDDKKNNLAVYSKTKDLNSSSSVLISNQNLQNMNDIMKLQRRKANTLTPFDNNNLANNPKVIKNELKKITNFKKVLTRNSKSITNKYGREMLSKLNGNKRNNTLNIFKKKKPEVKKSKFSSNIIINSNNFNKSCNNLNNNSNLDKISQKNINVNIINSFKIINNNETIPRRNSSGMLLIKPKTITKQANFHGSYKKLSFSLLDSNFPKKIENNTKKNISLKNNIKYNFDSFKISKNISINYKKTVTNDENKDKIKLNGDVKIGFYGLLVNDWLKQYFKKNLNNLIEREEFEEEKRKFLYQLFYCLELSKIYIFNFKQDKLTQEQPQIALVNNASSPKNSKEIPTFKHFYEIFSDYSQIKISSQEKYEAYPNIEHVNQYFIFKDKQIGKGGSSVVYLGEDEKQKKYAIKVTPKNIKANPFKNIYDYVKEEVSILKRIHSKYIVTTYEVIESRNKIYIIMEYMSAGSVLNILELMDENKIRQYTKDLICAVEHCHEIANIIHKDINVNNILINQDGVAKLCDFGISEPFEEDNDLLLSKGPSTYTPPEKKCQEKYRGKPADIYLIGLTLFHMVFKKPLFTDFGNLTTNDYINIVIPKKDNKNREINENLYNLIESLLKFNPEERPTINKLKKDPWLTDNMKSPFPDVMKEALFYSLELTKRRIKEFNEGNEEKNNDSSNIDDEDIKENNENEEEESSEDSSSISGDT